MPSSDDLVQLIRLGPFKKLNTHLADIYNDQTNAVIAINADTHRAGGGLSNYYGRKAVVQFPSLFSIAYTTIINVSQSLPYYLAEDTVGNTQYWTGNSINPVVNTTFFNQAVESNGGVFLNNGRQLYVRSDLTLGSCAWQFPKPKTNVYNYSVTAANSDMADPPLAKGTYDYAFVQVVYLPTVNGNVKQYTQPNGDVPPFPFSIHSNGDKYAVITGTFSGENSDGLQFKTLIYRQSTDVPVWYSLTTDPIEGSEYFDSATSQSIAGNAQIYDGNQVPPPAPNLLPPITAYQDRMWVLSRVQTADTNNVPQTQLWYSNVGQPWSFNSELQVLLLDDQDTVPVNDSPLPLVLYGKQPMALVNMGSTLLAFLNDSTWTVVGSDSETYLPIPLFNDIGCIARASAITANGLVFWLSAQQGVYSFDGGSLSYLSDDIYEDLLKIPPLEQAQACAGYEDQSYLLSFPTRNITFSFYLPTREWTTLPYAATSFGFETNVGVLPPGVAFP